ncbi:MAG TPA: cytochrome c3 family protein [Longimicrobiales bacterium]|nr:cytochrome c3 family protein [Longimicrobiales bacterium]
MRARAVRIAVALLLTGATLWAWSQQDQRFPHERHANLFPLCESCHAGATTGAADELYPQPSSCAQCHDGKREGRVGWTGPDRDPSNLKFSHTEHAAGLAGRERTASCNTCHGVAGSQQWMNVAAAEAENCLECHARGEAPKSHLAQETRCQTCHVTVVEAAQLDLARIAELPQPPSHDAVGFIAEHAPSIAAVETNCAVCHARQSCARCHANAEQVPAIAALRNDSRFAALLSERAAFYPRPASHAQAGFMGAHGSAAEADIASCSNCHTRPSCQSCHVGGDAADLIARLPEPAGTATGVAVEAFAATGIAAAAAPPSHAQADFATKHGGVAAQNIASCSTCHTRANCQACHTTGIAADLIARMPERAGVTGVAIAARARRMHPAGFATMHSVDAAGDGANCSSCHEQKFCADCHRGGDSRKFHPPNFAARHGPDSYAASSECSSCHSREVFCQSCHAGLGLATAANTNAASGSFHNRQPIWLLQHGQAARQNLEGCTSCHTQNNCLRCHSTKGGWGVSPHGPNFNAARERAKNPITCSRCHFGPPPGSR